MRRRTLAIGAIVLGGAALLLFCCAGRDERNATAPVPSAAVAAVPTETTPSAVPPFAAPGAATNEPVTPPPSSASAEATTSAPSIASGSSSAVAPQAGPGARIASAVQTSDPRDLELLASIERELKRDPPNEVHAIIAARKRGAERAELTRMIGALPDLGLRALAFRWLDRVAPAADAGAR